MVEEMFWNVISVLGILVVCGGFIVAVIHEWRNQ